MLTYCKLCTIIESLELSIRMIRVWTLSKGTKMPKITSTDALIERIKEAYPDRPLMPDRVVDAIERGYLAGAYDMLNNSGFGRTYSYSISHDEILATVDENGEVIPEKFAELIETVRREIRDAALEPVRWQLQDDFKASYEFTWIPDF